MYSSASSSSKLFSSQLAQSLTVIYVIFPLLNFEIPVCTLLLACQVPEWQYNRQEIAFGTSLGIYAAMLWNLGRILRHVAFWIGDLPWYS